MGRKRRRRIPIVLIVALVLCLGMVIFCGSQLAGIFLEYKEGTDEFDDLRKYVEEELPEVAYGEREDADTDEEGERRLRIDLEALRSENKDVVGWIEIPDTEISYLYRGLKQPGFYRFAYDYLWAQYEERIYVWRTKGISFCILSVRTSAGLYRSGGWNPCV